ncbi:MAG: hypothetical protein ACK40X_12075, partial [Armatimonadota bacterium]
MMGRGTKDEGRVKTVTLAPLHACSIVLFVLLLSLPGCGGLKLPGLVVPTVTVSGTIYEALLLEDKPISGAWVTINGSMPAYTDSLGRFTVNVPVTDTSGQTIQVAVSVAKHGYLARLVEGMRI